MKNPQSNEYQKYSRAALRLQLQQRVQWCYITVRAGTNDLVADHERDTLSYHHTRHGNLWFNETLRRKLVFSMRA